MSTLIISFTFLLISLECLMWWSMRKGWMLSEGGSGRDPAGCFSISSFLSLAQESSHHTCTDPPSQRVKKGSTPIAIWSTPRRPIDIDIKIVCFLSSILNADQAPSWLSSIYLGSRRFQFCHRTRRCGRVASSRASVWYRNSGILDGHWQESRLDQCV